MKFLKIGNEIINLAHVQNITLQTKDNGGKVLYFYTDVAAEQVSYVAYGNAAEYVWNHINKHLDMTVCPIPQVVTK